MRRSLFSIAAALALTSVASGYYHFITFNSRTNPVPIPLKFDLNALGNKTIYYFISDQGPSQLATGDTTAGMISQIRLAAKVWNDVETSDLRIGFGGMSATGSPQTTPGIDVLFTTNLLSISVPPNCVSPA